MKKKTIALLLALALVFGGAVGGTIAWLTAESAEVKNTFTVGDINITLAETTGSSYKMVPGSDIAKDPKVTVKADSEACWLFVEITGSDNYSTYLEEYTMAEGWIALTGETGVYYREVDATTADTSFYVLGGKSGYENGYVVVKEDVTKTQMNGLTEANYPTLTFKAYACQKDNVTSAADAWAKVKPATPTT